MNYELDNDTKIRPILNIFVNIFANLFTDILIYH